MTATTAPATQNFTIGTGDDEHITVTRTDHGGWTVTYEAGALILATDGCWIPATTDTLTSAAGEQETTWADRGDAIHAAYATL